jgi:2'-5' RNA ligase
MRAFLAVDLSPDLKAIFVQTQDRLKSIAADVKWVPPAQAHLTLQFLGDIGEDRLPVIYENLAKIAAETSAFELSLGPVDGFPNISNPRVIWMGVQGGGQQLTALKIAPADQRFHAHVTLGRVRSPKTLNLPG